MDLNDAWKKTCRVIFGGEIGELDGYAAYLNERHYMPYKEKRSAVSGKGVIVGSDRYCDGAGFVSEDEVDYGKKYLALGINEVKDLDSIISALSDRFLYAGNKIFGNSKFVENADNCSDSFYVKNSHTVVSSKYVAYSSFVRMDSSNVFGSNTLIRGNHLIRITGGADIARCFECSLNVNCSDMFFCFDCTGCAQAMFSFNLQNRKYCIGNLELPKEKYLAIKEKLLEESREYLVKHKKFHSLFDFGIPKGAELAGISVPKGNKGDGEKGIAEGAFRSATRLIFGKELSPMGRYEKFLSERSEPVREIKTAFGSESHYCNYFWCKYVPKGRMATREEAFETARRHIAIGGLENASVEGIISKLGQIAFYNVDYDTGGNSNIPETPMKYYSSDCFRVGDATYSKKCGYTTHVQNCDSVFGSSVLMMDSSYSLRCHDCVKVSQCMDMDCCKNCYRSMFCHNCEGLSDSMFCFNTKNKSYAIGNVELGREEYMRIRGIVVKKLLQRLEKQGTFGFDICDLGCYKGKKA